MISEFSLFTKSLQDYFTKPMLKLAFLPFVFTVIIFYALFFIIADVSLDALKDSTIHMEQTHTVTNNGVTDTTTINETYEGGNGIIEFLLKNSITSWLIGFFVYTVGTIAVMMLSVFISLVVIGFLTPNILNILQKRHYTQIQLNDSASLFMSILTPIKYTFIMLILFIVLIPLYFIPIVNIVAFNLPFYYMFHKLLNFDITSNIKMTQDEHFRLKYQHSNQVRLRTLLLYFISMIPFMALIASVFYIIYLGRGQMEALKELRKEI
ncbi:MAG: EI24 domain-containing protein [Campylobacterota bacterium]|nr:EI24 domain-containing protein [Campylobacterota bacterium]